MRASTLHSSHHGHPHSQLRTADSRNNVRRRYQDFKMVVINYETQKLLITHWPPGPASHLLPSSLRSSTKRSCNAHEKMRPLSYLRAAELAALLAAVLGG